MPYGIVNADVIQSSVSGVSLGAGNASIMKNRIINGAMVIDQRNAGASVTPTATGVNNYTLDRWALQISQASKLSIQQNAGSVTPPVGFSNYLGVTSLAATTVGAADYYELRQYVEGFNFADMGFGTANAKSVTLSFWVRSSLTGTFSVSLYNSAANRFYPATYTILVANTWEQKTITIAGDTTGTWVGATNGIGATISFDLGTGSNYTGTGNTWSTLGYAATGSTQVVGTNGATFYITGVQLEVGTSATGFEYVNYQTSLANCQRYFEKSYDIATVPATNTNNGRFQQTASSDGNGNMVLNIRFSVQKRSAPTMTAYAPSGTINLWTKSSASGIADVTLNWEFQTTGGTGAYLAVGNNSAVCAGNGHWTASAEL